ncbi:MarR family winged helix-turn-helix transcriptional regulator [Paludibacterium paludis]|uniref:MarR family transcriptional regulator n=1 Tax=Paludibacterium paludis TaxID=1225769 RepID=A0A918U9I2_9NEIS|nr:MarR family transcriptional regulator [Paludibacterium paludis]GGY12080.1 MarR family transcriptional regulator [Paludibacterium paludis]
MRALRLPCHCGSLRQATRAVTQLYDRHLQPCGLTINQFGLLRFLDALPGTTVAAIADAMVMDSTTLTRTLAGLKQRGWIASVPGRDRREKLWSLEPDGKAVMVAAMPLWEAAQRELEARMAGVDMETLSRTSFALARALADDPG